MARGLRIGHVRSVRIAAEKGEYVNTGIPAGMVRASILSSEQGSYSTSGQDATLLLSSVSDSWLARSTAPGVQQANRLDSASVLAWRLLDGTEGHISIDSAVAPEGGTASVKFSVLNSDTTSNGQLSIPLSQEYGNGETVWFSYRVRAPKEFCYQNWPSAATGNNTAHKLSILSRNANGTAPLGSNQVNEVVVQVNNNLNMLSGYYRDAGTGSTFVGDQVGFVSPCSSTDVKWDSTAIDRGVNPLVGTNPDTGAAWTSCEQERARWAMLYSAYSTPGAANVKRGLGDPLGGGVRQVHDEWITITGRVSIGTFGTASSRMTLWAARYGQPYERFFDQENITLGSGPNYNALNLLPYTSARDAGGRQISARTNNITGVTLLSCSLSTPLGAGTLSYNASTQRFTWAGAGQSAGTARGFSATNDILRINVVSATSTDYIAIEIDPDALPTSGTTSDTVTIADGRPDTFIHYCDFIESTAPIDAPGGYGVVPDYVADATAGQWTQIGTNTITTTGVRFTGWGSGGYPAGGNNYGDLYGVWSGCAYDPRRQTLYFSGGGHASYDGNEWYAFRLDLNQWERVNNPSPYLETQQVAGLLPDGLPQAIHTYGEVECDADGNIYRLSGGGSAIANIWKFDPNEAARPFGYTTDTPNAWTNTGQTVGTGYAGGFCWDATSRRFYGGHNQSGFFNARYYDVGTNTSGAVAMTGFPSGFAPDLYPSVALDTSRRLMYVVGGRGTVGAVVDRGTIVYNIASGTWTSLTSTTTGDKTPETTEGGGLTYDTRRDLMWYWHGVPTAKDLFKFDYTTKVWTKVSPSGSSPQVPFTQGTFNKFRYIEEYDVFIAVGGNTATSTVQVWMYKPADWMA
jgi:hypothetical protein